MIAPHVTINRAHPNEWKAFKKIRLEALKNDPKVFSSTYADALEFSDEMWKMIFKDPDSKFFFAKNHSQVIGIARVTFNDSEENPETAVLGSLYINTKYRNKNIASRLIESRVEACTRKKLVKYVRAYIKIITYQL